MADILVLITIILVIFYAKEIKKTISSKFIMIFSNFDEKKRAMLSFYLMSEIQLDKVNLDDYKQIGEGGNGKTYVNPAALDVVLRTVFQKPNFVEKLFFGNYVRKLMKQYY